MIREWTSERFGERYRTMRLNSGFEISHYYKPFSLQAAFLSIDFGSLHRVYTKTTGEVMGHPMGSAHFLEHKLFERATEDVNLKMAKLGVSVNAYTSYDRTCFYFFGGTCFEEALALLLELPVFPEFTEKGVEREKKVIAREIELYEDDVDTLVYRGAIEALYPGHPISEEILGTADSIEKITAASLREIMRDCYTPSRMQLLLIGEFDIDVLEKIADALPTAYHEKREDVRETSHEVACTSTNQIRTFSETPLPGFMYLQKLPLISEGKERTMHHLQWEIILESLTGSASTLYTHEYAKGTILSLNSYTVDYPDVSFLCIHGEGREPEAFFDSLQKELLKLESVMIDPADYLRIRKRRIGERLRSFDQYAEISFRFFDQRRTGLSLFEEADLLFQLPEQTICLPKGDWVYSVVSKEYK